jgi:hypothetical protein
LPGFASADEGQATMVSSEARPMATATKLVVWMEPAIAPSCEKKFDGILSTAMPRKSRTCDNAMITAMPEVKPMTMETGTKRTSVPRRSAPMAKSSTPAIMVAMSRLATPYFSRDPVEERHERPRGPADLHARAAQRGDQHAADDGGDDALLGPHPRRRWRRPSRAATRRPRR